MQSLHADTPAHEHVNMVYLRLAFADVAFSVCLSLPLLCGNKHEWPSKAAY